MKPLPDKQLYFKVTPGTRVTIDFCFPTPVILNPFPKNKSLIVVNQPKKKRGTYQYRDADKRREYLKLYMRKRRATKSEKSKKEG